MKKRERKGGAPYLPGTAVDPRERKEKKEPINPPEGNCFVMVRCKKGVAMHIGHPEDSIMDHSLQHPRTAGKGGGGGEKRSANAGEEKKQT